MNEAEDHQTLDELWQECKKTNRAYCRALDKADIEKSFEHLRIASEDANTAHKEAVTKLTHFPRRGRI